MRSSSVKRLLITLAFLCLGFESFSQSKNAVFYELLGNSNLHSISYERQLSSKIGSRVGFGYFKQRTGQWNTIEDHAFFVPILITSKWGGSKNFLEVDAGSFVGIRKEGQYTDHAINITAFLGYRYEAEKGFLFRVGITPQYRLAGESRYFLETFWYWGGLSFGYHF